MAFRDLRKSGPDASAVGPAVDRATEAIRDALAELPQPERQAVVEHVRALARLTPQKRAALLALSDPDG